MSDTTHNGHGKLSDARVGERVRVISVAEDDGNLRLLEMGLVPGTPLEVARRAPFGGPLLIRVRGGVLAIDRSWAGAVHVAADSAPA